MECLQTIALGPNQLASIFIYVIVSACVMLLNILFVVVLNMACHKGRSKTADCEISSWIQNAQQLGQRHADPFLRHFHRTQLLLKGEDGIKSGRSHNHPTSPHRSTAA